MVQPSFVFLLLKKLEFKKKLQNFLQKICFTNSWHCKLNIENKNTKKVSVSQYEWSFVEQWIFIWIHFRSNKHCHLSILGSLGTQGSLARALCFQIHSSSYNCTIWNMGITKQNKINKRSVVLCHMSLVTCHVSGVTCQVLCDTFHLSHVAITNSHWPYHC